MVKIRRRYLLLLCLLLGLVCFGVTAETATSVGEVTLENYPSESQAEQRPATDPVRRRVSKRYPKTGTEKNWGYSLAGVLLYGAILFGRRKENG